MLTWKNTTSYSRDDKTREPREWTAHIGTFRLVVHRWVGAPDTWFATCAPFLNRYELTSKIPVDAQTEAERVLAEKVQPFVDFAKTRQKVPCHDNSCCNGVCRGHDEKGYGHGV